MVYNKISKEFFESVIHRAFPNDNLAKGILEKYNDISKESYYDAFCKIGTDSFFLIGNHVFGEALSKNNISIYFYHFTQIPTKGTLSFSNLHLGSTHTDELLYLFDHPPSTYDSTEEVFATKFRSYWANIAKSGSPNYPSDVPIVWPTFSASNNNKLKIESSFSVLSDHSSSYLSFWKKYLPDGIRSVHTDEFAEEPFFSKLVNELIPLYIVKFMNQCYTHPIITTLSLSLFFGTLYLRKKRKNKID